MPEKLGHQVVVRVSADMYVQLVQLARVNDRTMAQEVRRALRKHFADEAEPG